jgi:hypothetical protein
MKRHLLKENMNLECYVYKNVKDNQVMFQVLNPEENLFPSVTP